MKLPTIICAIILSASLLIWLQPNFFGGVAIGMLTMMFCRIFQSIVLDKP